MQPVASIHPDLKRALPDGRDDRLLLFVMRRMATSGVNDAHAANALLGSFGKSYRRPLILMRAMMLEFARASRRNIMVAPCCCPRMTDDEAQMMAALSKALSATHGAHGYLTELLDLGEALGPLTCVQAVAQAFADLGHPLNGA